MKVFTPTVLSTGLYQVSLLTDSIISSNLGQGEISKLSYSNTIMTLINTVILSNIMTYFYPKIAKDINNEDIGEFTEFDKILIKYINNNIESIHDINLEKLDDELFFDLNWFSFIKIPKKRQKILGRFSDTKLRRPLNALTVIQIIPDSFRQLIIMYRFLLSVRHG